MDAFEKWIKDHYNEHGLAPTPKECFRAGMRAAASMLSRGRFVTDKAWRDQYADILAEADK